MWWRTWRRALPILVAAFLVGSGGMAAVGASWANDVRRPRVTVLGAGNQLSVLVTAGSARLLLATGDDPVAFGNALARARHPTTRRLDVLLIAGNGKSLRAPAEARRIASFGYVAVLGHPPRTAEAEAAGVWRLPVLQTPRRIRLPDDVSVIAEVVETPRPRTPRQERDKTDPDMDVAWRLTVHHGGTVVAILSDGRDAAKFPSVGPVAALIVAGAHPEQALPRVAPQALVVSAESNQGSQLRHDVADQAPHDLWTLRVFAGDAVGLDLIPGGLRLPRDRSQRVQAVTPAPR